MGNLVVAREGGVDRGPPFHHVREHPVHDQVTHDHAERGPHERIEAAPVAARSHVAALRPPGRLPFEENLPAEEHQYPDDVEAVREESPVPGVGALLGIHPADGEDHVVGFAGEKVSAARAAVGEETLARGVAALDLRTVGRARARDEPSRLLLHPAEGGDVVVRAEQDARLASTGLGREIGLPLGEPVAPLDEPAGHGGRAPVPHRPLQDRQRQTVDLEEDDSRSVRDCLLAGAAGDSLDHAEGVRVVVVGAEDDVEDDADRRGDERDAERRPERVDLEITARDPVGREQHQRIEHEDEHEPDQQHQRQAQGGDERRQDRVQDTDRRRGGEGAPEIVDSRAGNDPRCQEQGRGSGQPPDREPYRPELRAGRAPARGFGVCGGRHRVPAPQ